MTKDRVIGKDKTLPWHIPEDLDNFKRLTSGNTVVMGRKTYESIPKKFCPLPNRHNIVVSKTISAEDGIDVCRSIEEAIAKARSYGKEIFIIGGSVIYQQVLSFADKMYISYVKWEYEGDSYFPKFNKEEWEIEEQQNFQEFKLVVYKRK